MGLGGTCADVACDARFAAGLPCSREETWCAAGLAAGRFAVGPPPVSVAAALRIDGLDAAFVFDDTGRCGVVFFGFAFAATAGWGFDRTDFGAAPRPATVALPAVFRTLRPAGFRVDGFFVEAVLAALVFLRIIVLSSCQ